MKNLSIRVFHRRPPARLLAPLERLPPPAPKPQPKRRLLRLLGATAVVGGGTAALLATVLPPSVERVPLPEHSLLRRSPLPADPCGINEGESTSEDEKFRGGSYVDCYRLTVRVPQFQLHEVLRRTNGNLRGLVCQSLHGCPMMEIELTAKSLFGAPLAVFRSADRTDQICGSLTEFKAAVEQCNFDSGDCVNQWLAWQPPDEPTGRGSGGGSGSGGASSNQQLFAVVSAGYHRRLAPPPPEQPPAREEEEAKWVPPGVQEFDQVDGREEKEVRGRADRTSSSSPTPPPTATTAAKKLEMFERVGGRFVIDQWLDLDVGPCDVDGVVPLHFYFGSACHARSDNDWLRLQPVLPFHIILARVMLWSAGRRLEERIRQIAFQIDE